jgi:transcription elongation factor Elf1
MKTYKWTCKACETPNILTIREGTDKQYTLSCGKCGQPGEFEPKTERVHMMGDICSTTYYPGVPVVIGGPRSWVDY